MNIHGLKQKRKEVSKRLKEGKRNLGDYNYNKLIRRRTRINYQIKKLRKEKEDKEKNDY